MFARATLALAGKDEPRLAPVPELMALKNAPPAAASGPLFMAPPLLHDTVADVWLSQNAAIVQYIAAKHGLLPSAAVDADAGGADAAATAAAAAAAAAVQASTALKVMLDANDVLNEITRGTGSRMWEPEAWKQWRSTRFVKWLQVFEQQAVRSGCTEEEGRSLLGTPKPSMADAALFALLVPMVRCLPQLRADLDTHAPVCVALVNRLAESVPQLAKLRDEALPEGGVYCGGQIEASLRSMLELK